mgnify:CR=1 FL=1
MAQLETLRQDASPSNIAKLQNRLTALKQEIDDFEIQGIDNLNPEDKKRYQAIYDEVYGVGVKPTSEYTLEDYYNQIGFGGDSAFGQQISSKLNRIEELGLDKAANEVQVSDAFKYVMEESSQSDNIIDGLSTAFGAFWDDLNFSQKGDFIGDVLGRSAAATTAIVGTSLATALTTRGMPFLTRAGAQLIGVGAVSGEIEYSHSYYEYLRAKGMDINKKHMTMQQNVVQLLVLWMVLQEV